jgi:FixJ family two-component response regulator
MSRTAQNVAQMYDQLSEREQSIIAELIYRLLPDDIATPDDLIAIAESQADYERGEVVSHDDMDWD